MKPLPNSLEYSVEGSTRVSANNAASYSNNLLVSWKNQNESVEELWAEFDISGYPPHVRNLLTQTVTHEEIRIYSGATLETVNALNSEGDEPVKPVHLLIKSTKRSNIDRAVTWIKRLIDQAMNLPKYKEKVLIGLDNASPSFDVRGKVLGPGGANLQYITNETGAIVTLRGRGSGFIEPTTGLESIEPLHLCVEHNSKYEVLQAGRQLAFNLIETVQQEWFTYQQQHTPNSTIQNQQHTATMQQSQQHNSNPTLQNQQHGNNAVLQTQQHTVNPLLQHAAPQHLHIPPPSHANPPHHQGGVGGQPGQMVPPAVSAGLPPPLTTVPPPLLHQPPPATLQLATNLSQLVQAPPPHIAQPPPQLVQPQQQQLVQPQTSQSQLVHSGQPTQLVQSQQGQSAQLMQSQTGQAQLVQTGQPQLVQSSQPQSSQGQPSLVQPGQLVQTAQPQLLQQQPNLSLVQQNQPSILHTQQALSQGMLVPPGVGPGQTVQVVQTSQLSAAIQPSPQPGLQDMTPTHVYSTGAGSGSGTQVANILAQQVLPAGTSIIQQPHIISQTSYPQLQYMPTGGGSMAVLYGAAAGTATGGREGVMLVQYAGNTAGTRRIQPQIVQLVHPGTGQVMGAAPLLLQGLQGLQGPSTPLVLQQPTANPPPTGLMPPVSTATVLLQQPAAPQHQLQFTAQPQPIHILPPHPQTMMTVSSGGQVVTSSPQSNAVVSSTQHSLVSISPQAIVTHTLTAGQKRRFDQEAATLQGNSIAGVCVSVSDISSQHKKGVGDGSPGKVARERSASSPSLHSKLVLPASQSDEQDILQVTRGEMKPDPAKRGRTSHGDDLEVTKETKAIYTYSGNKVNYAQPPPQHSVLQAQSQHTSALQQGQHAVLQQSQHTALQPQGLVTSQLASSLPPPPPAQFTAPPPHYPPQYYQQPPYQTYQPSWNHMHNNNQ